MAVIARRVVISKGDVPRPGEIHLADSASINDRFAMLPRDLNSPLQEVWWAPLSNLPGLSEFTMINVRRAPIDGTSQWDRVAITVRTKSTRSAKIAIKVYASTADLVGHTTDVTLTKFDGFKHHTNLSASGAVTLTLPQADRQLRRLEFYFEVLAAQQLRIQANAADKIEEGGNPNYDFATSNTLQDRLILEVSDANLWKVTDRTAGWTFGP